MECSGLNLYTLCVTKMVIPVYRFIAALLITFSAFPAFADEPVIEQVTVSRNGDLWTFDVTISHPDSGWDHYADTWRILDENGRSFGQRDLAHPHIEEQPFTRSLSGVTIPSEVRSVIIQAHDTVSGWSGAARRVDLK